MIKMCEYAMQQRYMQLTTGYIQATQRKKKLRIYLAHQGSLGGKFWGTRLQECLEELGYEVVNPFSYNEEARELTNQWDVEKIRNEEISKKIVKKDLGLIDSCDVVVAMVLEQVDSPTIGMPMEIFYAFCHHKPIIIFTEFVSPWLIAHGKVVKTYEELLEELKKCTVG